MPLDPSRLAERERLLAHAAALVGVSLAELADGLGLPVPAGHLRTKGWPGQIIERELGAGDSRGRGQDFAALGTDEIRRRFGPDAITSVAAAERRATRARRRSDEERR